MKLNSYIFCDDIRNEEGNKVSLMGVYNSNIIVNTSKKMENGQTIPFRLAALLRISFEPGDTFPNRLKFNLKLNGEKLVNIDSSLTIKDPKLTSIAIKGDALPMMEGNIGFELVLLSDEKKLFSDKIDDALQVTINEGKGSK